MLARHLAGLMHNQMPEQIRALLPPDYKVRPPRAPRPAGQVPAMQNLEELDDDEDEGNLVIDTSAVSSEPDDGSYHPPSQAPTTEADTTADTVLLSGTPTPAHTPMPSPIRPRLTRSGSRQISASSDHPMSETVRRRSSRESRESFGGDLDDPGVLPPPEEEVNPGLSRQGSGLSGKFEFCSYFLKF